MDEGKSSDMVIAGNRIPLGRTKLIEVSVARLPSGTNITIPVHVLRSKHEGPCILLLAGLHGDEINGIETLRRMLKSGELQPDFGSVICIPLLNVFGFINYSREVPDGKDVNRSFPGSARGSLASRVAYMFMKEIFPKIDFGIDYHTGGKSRANYPQMRCVFEDEKSMEMALTFGAPLTLNAKLRDHSLRKSASLNGVPIIVFEGGESHRIDEESIRVSIEGTHRVLKKMGVKKGTPEEVSTTLLYSSSWMRANKSGLFQATVELGEVISKNQIVGIVGDLFGREEKKIKARKPGIVIGLNNNPVVSQGDAILHIAYTEKTRE
jgi:hypothetical protein